MNLLIKYKNKKLSIEVHKCNFIEKIIGLMFSRRENAKILLFEFKSPTNMTIHSFFVFFPFLAIWIDENGKIIQKTIIKPWKTAIKPDKNFVKLIEIPINSKNSNILKFLVGDTKHL